MDVGALGSIGSVVMFSLPRRESSSIAGEMDLTKGSTRVFKCTNVQISSNAGSSLRDLLWRVNVIPSNMGGPREENGTVSTAYFNAPGYLFLNDEGDGFRLTWSTEECFLVTDESALTAASTTCPLGDGAVFSHVDIITQEKTWEEMICDVLSGERVNQVNGPNDVDSKDLQRRDLGVAYEAFLHVDVLLAEIIAHRKGISEHHPEFVYNLISVHCGGRVADLIIAFFRKKKSCYLGVFAKVDLFTGRYQELDWVQSVEMDDASSLQLWCNRLALNRRMKQVRAGPYAVDAKRAMDWTRLAREVYTFDNDEEDDYDEEYWTDFVCGTGGETTKRTPPKLITQSSLYPSCDVITNRALISCQPVLSMRAKDSPIHLVYG
jgi:hypothetical protein